MQVWSLKVFMYWFVLDNNNNSCLSFFLLHKFFVLLLRQIVVFFSLDLEVNLNGDCILAGKTKHFNKNFEKLTCTHLKIIF